jgi:hypothetical protein
MKVPAGCLVAALVLTPLAAEAADPSEASDPGFYESITASGAQRFYDGYDEARKLTNAENYAAAIRKYAEILPFATSKAEKAMVYKDLSLIYQTLDEPDRECYYAERAAQSTPDAREKGILTARVRALRNGARKAGAELIPRP